MLIFWYQKMIFWYQKMIFWYQKLISDIRFSDIRKSISDIRKCVNFWYQKIIFWYQKLFSDIRNYFWYQKLFLISEIPIVWYQKTISDIRKSNFWCQKIGIEVPFGVPYIWVSHSQKLRLGFVLLSTYMKWTGPASKLGAVHVNVTVFLVAVEEWVTASPGALQSVVRVLTGRFDHVPVGLLNPLRRACNNMPWKSPPDIVTEGRKCGLIKVT